MQKPDKQTNHSKSKITVISVSQRKNSDNQELEFVDYRPDSKKFENLQFMIDGQIRKRNILQKMDNGSDDELDVMMSGEGSISTDHAIYMISDVLDITVAPDDITEGLVRTLIGNFRAGVSALLEAAGDDASEIPIDDYHTWEPLTGVIMKIIELSAMSQAKQTRYKRTVARIKDRLEDD